MNASQLTEIIQARALLRCCVTTGPTGATGPAGPSISLGNVAIVDVNGDNSTASVGGKPFSTIQAAISAVSSGQTVWVMPGTHLLTGGITIPDGISLRGISLQTTILQLSETSSTTMITMGENCRVEDLTINLTCTGSTDNVILKGILFGGTTSQTSKLRNSVVNVRNSTMASSLTSTVTGIEANGTGVLSNLIFSFNSVKGCTINIFSNGKGDKRGILISNSNQMSTRDTNIYVAEPVDTSSSPSSYVGVETKDPNNIGSIQLRSTTVGVVIPASGEAYTASDILQTNPTIITDPTYLRSAGIQIGPGTDLVTKSAGSKGFSTYVYYLIIYYCGKGNITSGLSGGFLWPGTQLISAGNFPDPGLPAAYFRAQQPCLLSGMSAGLNVPCGGTGGGSTLTVTVYYTPIANLTTYSGYISTTNLTVTSAVVGTIVVGQYVVGNGVTPGTYIVSGSGVNWVVNASQTVGSSGSPVAFRSNLAIATPISVVFGKDDVKKTFYNASVRLDTGDDINVYTSYTTSGSNSAHDLQVQVDVF